MKSIIKAVIISIIVVAIIGYAENRKNQSELSNDSLITTNDSFYSVAQKINGSFIATKYNDSLFTIRKINWTTPTISMMTKESEIMVRVISTADNATFETMYKHFKVEINQSFITNITYNDGKMIIFVDKPDA